MGMRGPEDLEAYGILSFKQLVSILSQVNIIFLFTYLPHFGLTSIDAVRNKYI